MIFDDGSTIDESTGASTNAPPGMMLSDLYEAQKMAPFQQADTGQSWWQGLMQYGITRAIDNRYGPPVFLPGNTATGTFAGANGRTYYQAPNGQGGVPMGSGGLNLSQNMLLLLIGGGVLLFALKD